MGLLLIHEGIAGEAIYRIRPCTSLYSRSVFENNFNVLAFYAPNL